MRRSPSGRACGVEVDLRGVLPQPGRHHVLGVGEGHAVDVVDLLADLVVVEAVRLTRGHEVVVGEVQARGDDQVGRIDDLGQFRDHRLRRGSIDVALVHHHPAGPLDRDLVALVRRHRPDVHDPALAVGVLLQTDDGGTGAQGVAGHDGCVEAAFRVAQVRHGVQRDVRHGLAERDVEADEFLDRVRLQAHRRRERRPRRARRNGSGTASRTPHGRPR